MGGRSHLRLRSTVATGFGPRASPRGVRSLNQIVEAGLLKVVDLAERNVPDVLAATLKEATRIRQTRSVRDSQLHASLTDRQVTDDTLVSGTEAVGQVGARSVDRLFDLGDQFTNKPPTAANQRLYLW